MSNGRPNEWQDTPRARIIERFEAALAYPVTLVVAPPGFGKTTALKQLIRDRADAIYVRTRRGTSLEMFIRDFASSCAALLPATITPPEEPTSDTAAALEICVLWAATHLRGTNCLIVIDDLQFGESDPAIADFIARIVEDTKGSVRWILSTRSRGSLPITRWQAYGDADAPITAEDLRFTLEEAVEIAANVGSPASTNDLQRWVNQTGGFAVPLSYAIRLSARRSSVDAIIDGTRAITFDFLAEQVWSSLSEDDRSLLKVSAFLPPTHVHDLERSGIAAATARVSRLSADIAFISFTADGIFSMHDLFRDFIREQLTLAGPIESDDCVRKASKVLSNAKQFDEALRLSITQNDLEQASLVLEIVGTAGIDHATMTAMINAFSDRAPAVLSLEMLTLNAEHWAWNSNWHKSRSYATELLSRDGAHSNQILKALKATLRAVYQESESERREWLETSAAHVDRLGRTERTVYDAIRASVLAQFQECRDEAQALVSNVGSALGDMQPTEIIDTHIAVANARHYLGDTDGAVLSAKAAVETALVLGDPRETARTLNTLGIMMIYSRDSEIEKLFEPLREAVEQTGSWRYSQTSHWVPASHFVSKGDVAAAERARESLRTVPVSNGSQRKLLLLFERYCRNLGHLLGENYCQIVSDHLRTASPESPDHKYSQLVIAATAYTLLSDNTASNELLRSARQIRDTFSQRELGFLAESIILETICLGSNELWPQARRLTILVKTFSSAYAPIQIALERFVQGPPFSGLNDALSLCDGRPHIGLAAIMLRRVAKQLSNSSSRVNLTTAELAVLRLLVLGKSNKEIAEARNRSAETVKRQVATLYRKLGVENRTSALAVARERALL